MNKASLSQLPSPTPHPRRPLRGQVRRRRTTCHAMPRTLSSRGDDAASPTPDAMLLSRSINWIGRCMCRSLDRDGSSPSESGGRRCRRPRTMRARQVLDGLRGHRPTHTAGACSLYSSVNLWRPHHALSRSSVSIPLS